MSHRHSIYCIVPPHMLKNIAAQGTAEQREIALRTITESEQFRGHRRAVMDVLSFTAVSEFSQGKNRSVYDAENGTKLPGTLVRGEGDGPVSDVAVNEAYDGSGVTYDLYYQVFGRDSIDGQGLPLKSTVHYQKFDMWIILFNDRSNCLLQVASLVE